MRSSIAHKGALKAFPEDKSRKKFLFTILSFAARAVEVQNWLRTWSNECEIHAKNMPEKFRLVLWDGYAIRNRTEGELTTDLQDLLHSKDQWCIKGLVTDIMRSREHEEDWRTHNPPKTLEELVSRELAKRVSHPYSFSNTN